MGLLGFRRQKVVLRQEEDCPEEVRSFLAHLDKSLDEFGPTVKYVVYHKFHLDHGLNRADIPKKPDLFVDTIDRMFGPCANVVKSYIEREMKEVISLKKETVMPTTTATELLKVISSQQMT